VTNSMSATYTTEEYESEALLDMTALVVCEDDEPPKYYSESGISYVWV
jgi:hypothetical protein